MATNPKDQEKKEEKAGFIREQPVKDSLLLTPEIKPEVPVQTAEKEKAPERAPEVEEKKEEAKKIEAPQSMPVATTPIAAVLPAKSEALVDIERILEEDLGQIYFKMSPQQQLAFRVKGEETAMKIEKLIHETKATVRKIFKLIREWLKLIPGVNRYFLEQASKIKTDRVMKIK